MEPSAQPPQAEPARADYAPSRLPELGARIAQVAPGSPAWEAGLEPGMEVATVNGVPLDDLITWRWETAEDRAWLEVRVPGDPEPFGCELVRESGQPWGLEFCDVLFDGVRTCKNACVFCFMSMLPEGLRSSLYLRDDDYRLSFLQGNFVTLTNVDDDDLARILRLRLAPMNVSLHAVTPEVRRRLMGRNHARGLEVLEALCQGGIEVHGQVVLCPGINDGEELEATLRYVEERPQITSLAVVPLGYTKHSPFSASYSDDPEAARRVVEQIRPFQERSRQRTGATRFQLSDEFYVAAGLPVPSAASYDGFPQYYDGIGMLRSFLDETDRTVRERPGELERLREALAEAGMQLLLVSGEAPRQVYERWIRETGLCNHASLLCVRNDYFGGDVNVTGLIVAQDLLAQLPQDLRGLFVVLPGLMLNADGVTLDGVAGDRLLEEVRRRGGQGAFLTTLPDALLTGLMDALCTAPTANGYQRSRHAPACLTQKEEKRHG